MAIGDKLLAKTANVSVKETLPTIPNSDSPRTSPGRLLDVQGKIHAAEEKVSELQDKLGHPLKISINKLAKSLLQTRKLDIKRVNELAEHLNQNELTTPIIVRPTINDGDGDKFEIVAGHHRVEAFKQLGRTEIDAIIRPMSDEEAEKRIFFDNLMAPDLPDFEKYKGFAAIRKRTGQSYDALAKAAGISKTLVAYYFSFDKLPEKILSILSNHPEIIGANAAQKIAAIKTDENKLASAFQKLVAGELDQKSIISFLKNELNLTANSAILEDVVKHGEQTICTLQNKNNKTFTLIFKKEFCSKEWHQKLLSFIEKESTTHLYK